MTEKLIVLDFDGTLTDAEAEGRNFVTGYKQALRILTEMEHDAFETLFNGTLNVILHRPDLHGIVRQGRVVAPAIVDPYLRMQTIANMIFDKLGLFRDKTDRARLIELLFATNYGKTQTVFRQGARELLGAVLEHEAADVCIVTNARTRGVERKLDQLGDDAVFDRLQLYDNAQKFTLGPKPEQVPETINLIQGKSRVAYPRRQKYFEVLDQLRRERGLKWSDITVIGDIFELDLLMPFLLGCTVILVANDNTPQYEIDYIHECGEGRAHVFGDLNDVRGFLIGY